MHNMPTFFLFELIPPQNQLTKVKSDSPEQNNKQNDALTDSCFLKGFSIEKVLVEKKRTNNSHNLAPE